MKAVVEWLASLTGEVAPVYSDPRPQILSETLFRDNGIGYSQFNELLLSLGYDRVSDGFFRYVFGGRNSIRTFSELRSGIEGFRKKAMLGYGNFKYAYKQYAKSSLDEMNRAFDGFQSRGLEHFDRHHPLVDLKKIDRRDTKYLGYITQQEILNSINNSNGAQKSATENQLEYMEKIQELGKHNHDLYLTYDHMDVYIATSMRSSFDFWNVSKFIDELFSSPLVNDLKLRWFDPTQAYCDDRLDKGLVEGLMLKRAECTIYLAQETETLGKDSELAATLAQGKPVIAYVPRQRDFNKFSELTELVKEEVYPGRDPMETAMEFLKLFAPDAAWKSENTELREWINNPASANYDAVIRMIFDAANQLYDRKATNLQQLHPLGLQVNLRTGVANGVLVARSIPICAKLLRMILTRTLEFDIEETNTAYILRDRLTHSVFRVVTKDRHVTNAFWNFYPEIVHAD